MCIRDSPNVEIVPATRPTVKAIPGLAMTPDGAPIATPPASVALRMSSIENFSRISPLVMKAAKQLPVKEIIVLLITCDFWNPFYGK